jgi:DNA polymerase-4
MPAPTQLANEIFACGRALLQREADGMSFRLIGIGVSNLVEASDAVAGELIENGAKRIGARERAVDTLRARFGADAVIRGLALKEPDLRIRRPLPVCRACPSHPRLHWLTAK